MTQSAANTSLSKLLRRASEVLAGSRRHMSEAMLAAAERIERRRAVAKARCGDIHRLGCECDVLAAIDEPDGAS